jgi:sugar diacid utilization regulator
MLQLCLSHSPSSCRSTLVCLAIAYKLKQKSTMTIFDDNKSRTGMSDARKREREVARLMTKLLEMEDETKLLEGLADLGVTPDHPRHKEILRIWRDAR